MIIVSVLSASSSVVFFDVVKSALINNAGLSPLSCRVVSLLKQRVQEAQSATLLRLMKGGYLLP